MVVQMQFVFENPENKYFPGEIVSGRLIVTTDETITLRNISVKFQGKAKTHWTENDDTYSAQLKYFKNIITLFGGKGYDEELQAGEYSYEFSMLLPENIPSSIKSTSGRVHYKVKAKVDRPLQRDPNVEALLNVISPVDLNMDPELKTPLTGENHKYFCCCCCKKGPLTIASKIPLRGYVPGDVIQIFAEVDNASDTEIMFVKCRLRRVVICYTAQRKRFDRREESVVSEQLEGSVPQNGSRTWRCSIQVPLDLTPSFLDKCEIIDVNYVVQVLARPAGVHTDLVNNLPIVIGTTPLVLETRYMNGNT